MLGFLCIKPVRRRNDQKSKKKGRRGNRKKGQQDGKLRGQKKVEETGWGWKLKNERQLNTGLTGEKE